MHCDHSLKSYWTVLSCGAVCFVIPCSFLVLADKTHKLTPPIDSPNVNGFIAHLVEHRTGNVEGHEFKSRRGLPPFRANVCMYQNCFIRTFHSFNWCAVQYMNHFTSSANCFIEGNQKSNIFCGLFIND